MTIRGRAGFATWFSRVSPEERGISEAWRGRRAADALPTGGRQRELLARDAGQAGCGRSPSCCYPTESPGKASLCVPNGGYRTADIADKYTQFFAPHRRRDPGSARWV